MRPTQWQEANTSPARPDISIPRRFNGPPGSANGGYACGVFATAAAAHLEGPAAVTLLAPPPLDTPMTLLPGPRRSRITQGDTVIATVSRAAGDPVTVAPVTAAVAEAASRTFEGARTHCFPTCFACGTDPTGGEGLRLAPGRLEGRPGAVACLWTPAGAPRTQVDDTLVWAALDCPGGWAGDPLAEPMVLSRMAAVIPEPLTAGRTYVVVGELQRRHGRTATAATALYDESGRLAAKASAVWVAVPDGLPAHI